MITAHSSVLSGLSAQPVNVEVQVQNGLPRFSIIGLADNAVRESRERVLAALTTAGFVLPDQILVNLAPAELRKGGVSMDLAIAIGIAAAGGLIPAEKLKLFTFAGELGLDGSIKPIRGAIAHAVLARRAGRGVLIIPEENAGEAALIEGLTVYGASQLHEVISFLKEEGDLTVFRRPTLDPRTEVSAAVEDVVGQESAKRALEIALSGGHHLLMVGPPGCGKTMLAKSTPSLLPPLTNDERLEVIGIHSIASQPIEGLLEGYRPFRAPHYGISEAGLIGGGGSVRPGEISFSHRGVLFLDEFPEFSRGCLEALRIPLEQGGVTVSRVKESVHLPAAFQLIAAMNPCPCGTTSTGACRCSEIERQRYMKRLSHPILDRIDIHTGLKAVPADELLTRRSDPQTSNRRDTIWECRERCLSTYGKLPAHMTASDIKALRLSSEARKLVEIVAGRAHMSARGIHKLLKVAATIASMKRSDILDETVVTEAFGLRLH